ncbi:MAG: FAD-dependent oxidoreductase [Pseudomonadota bacterium]|nr:FAD-dependent oxidoreductase [Chloroflexota bacterium]MDP9413913.1 FAD-dependent oxidoreductase [Pseudomonadota bacterium]
MIDFFPDGTCVRFYRSVERTCSEIATFSPRDADAYVRFIRLADPIVELSLTPFRFSEDNRNIVREGGKWLRDVARLLLRMRPLRLASTLTGPYGALIRELFETEYARTGITALAAHGTLGPHTPGAAFFACFQAAYHRYGNWHAKGGSGALADAMRRRLEAWGGEVRTAARVTRILVNGRVQGVALADGERIAAPRVVTAINPQTALLDLLGAEHLPNALVHRLWSRHRSNAVQFVVHAALDRLPPWLDAPSDA